MRNITFLLAFLITAQLAMAQKVTLNVQVFQDDAYATTPVNIEGATVTISNATALPDGLTATTDVDGIATFEVDEPTASVYYDYTISKDGYTTLSKSGYSGIYLGIYTSFPYTYKKALMKLYNVAFTVVDGTKSPIENAQIIVSGSYPAVDTLLTDATGKAAFLRNASGQYSSQTYTISADGFADTTSSFKLTYNYEGDFAVDTVKMKQAYSIIFTVNDGSNPVDGANIELISGDGTSESFSTDVSGQAVFTKKIDGDYDYVITRTGFIDEYGSVSVSGSDATPTVSLTAGYDLTFTVINGASGTVGLQQDTITIDGHTKITTSSSNVLTFGVAPGSSYTFDNVKAGFVPQTINTGVINANTDITIYMEPVYSVTFKIYDATMGLPVENAEIAFDGNTATTGTDGSVAFENIAASADAYTYTVTPPAGSSYKGSTGTVSCPLSSNSWNYLNGTNNKMSQYIYLEMPYASFSIMLEGSVMGYRFATVKMAGKEATPDFWGSATISVAPGTYEYEVVPDADSLAIIRGTVTVTENVSPSVSVYLINGKTISYTVVDADMTPLEDVSVEMEGVVDSTDDIGYVEFKRKAINTTYVARFDKAGYATVIDTVDLIDTDIDNRIVTMYAAQSVTFNVVDGNDNPVQGAEVIFAQNSDTTNASGSVILGASDGTYSYKVLADGYALYQGSVTVEGADVTENVKLETAGYGINFTIVANVTGLYPLPAVTINVVNDANNFDEIYYTDLDGMVSTPEVLAAGTYTCTISVDGYRDSVVNVTITDATVTLDAIALNPSKDLRILVKDGTLFIAGAEVVFDGEVYYSGDDGIALIPQCLYGTHQFTVTATGYEVYTGSTTVSNYSGTDVFAFMTASTSNITFNITDGTSALEGATVALGESSLSTDASGVVTFTDLANGEYAYTVTLDGYKDVTGTVTVMDEDVTIDVKLTTGYGINFTFVANVAAKDPVSDASISVVNSDLGFSETYTTDAEGKASVPEILQEGIYTCTITKDGYKDSVMTVTISDVTITVDTIALDPAKDLTFVVKSGDSFIEGASVVFNGQTYYTGNEGTVSVSQCVYGTYELTVSAEGYNEYTGSVTVDASSDAEVTITLEVTTYDVTFSVTDGSSPLEGAVVTFNAGTLTTDASGVATFTGLVNGEYDYEVTLDGYQNATGTVTVEDGNVTEDVVMSIVEGVNEANADYIINVYPNPTNGMLNIDFGSVQDKNVKIAVVNVSGQVMEELQFGQSSFGTAQINLSAYSSGVYYIKVSGKQQTKTFKVLKR